MVKVAIFPWKAQPRGRQEDLSWESFRDNFLCQHTLRNDKDGSLFSLAYYPDDDVTRSDARVQGVWGLVVDFDNSVGKGIDARPSPSPTLPEDHESNLDGYTYAWYSTYSNKADWPKWRLVLPASRPLQRWEFAAAFDGLCSLLARDANIDPTCGELSRAYFLPSCPPEQRAHAFAGAVAGKLITPEELFACAEFAPAENVAPITLPDRGGVGAAQGRNDALKMIVAAMLARGEPLERIIAEVHEHDQAKHNPPLFTDRADGYRADSWSGAMRFVGNVLWSTANKRASSGMPPELPLIRRDHVATWAPTAPRARLPHLNLERKSIATHLLRPPGAVGMMCDWINASAIKPQPILALAASLTAFGAVVGRRVATQTDLRPNLYSLGIAGSGAGKEHARKCVKRLFREVGAIKMLGAERLASDSGLIDAVSNADGTCLFQIDEIGRMLAAIAGAKNAPHLVNIPTVLMEFYSSANTTFLGKQYAQTERKDIDQPNVCLYGTTVPNRFYAALTGDEVTDGFLARFLVFQSETDDPIEQDVPPDARAPSEGLIDAVKDRLSWPINVAPQGNLDAMRCLPRVLGMDAGATRAFDALKRDVTRTKAGLPDELKAIWNRAWENASKVALIASAGYGKGDRITTECAEFAVDLIMTLTHNLCVAATSHVSADRTDADLKRAARFVRASGADGISRNDLLRLMRCRTRELDEMLRTLVDSGQVAASTRKTSGRPVQVLVHEDFAQPGPAEQAGDA